MHKLVVLFALVAACVAAPRPGGLVAYSAPAVISPVVSPAVSSYSSYSTGVVHGSPVVPVVHSLPVAYSSVVHPVYV